MLKRVEKLPYSGSKVTNYGAEGCLFCLLILVNYSAICRYIFGRPVYFMEEVGGLLFMAVGLLSFGYTFSVKGHVRISSITNLFPMGVRDWFEVVASAISLFYLIVFIKLSCNFVYLSYLQNCHTTNAYIYEVPWMALMPISMIVCAVVILEFCISKVRNIVAKL